MTYQSEKIRGNLSQAIYDLSSYEFINGKAILTDYNQNDKPRILKEIKRLRAYILKYLKLLNQLSEEEKSSFLIDRTEFLINARLLK